jgi:DNA relaxase NicK
MSLASNIVAATGPGARAVGGGAGLGAADQPPYSNTGVENSVDTEKLHLGIDYFRGTTFYTERYVLKYLADLLSESVEVLGRGKNGYTRGYKLGEVLVYGSDTSAMGVNIELSGIACSQVGYHTLRTMYHVLELSMSRLDIAADYCPFTVEDVKNAWMADKVRSYIKPAKDARDEWKKIRACRVIESSTGDTFYMGNRASEKFARCYNEKGFTRFELELKGKQARVAAKKIFEDDDIELPKKAIGIIRAFADFVEKGSHRIHDKKLSWWEDFVQSFALIVLPLPKKVSKGLEDAREYIIETFGKTLKACIEVWGIGAILGRLDEVELKPKHRKMVAKYLKQNKDIAERVYRSRHLVGQVGMCT